MYAAGSLINLKKISEKVHELIGCAGVTRSDFILSEDSDVFFLEINTIPGLTATSLCPKEARAMGMSFSEFLGKQIDLALSKSGSLT